MQRMLARAGMLVALLAPTAALAAFNDVTLTTDTVLSVNSITLNVSGTSATIESITVNATDFSVTMQSGSSFKVTAPNLNRFSASTLTGVSTDICNANQSVIGYSPNTNVTVTITPSTVLCSSTSSGSGGGSTGGSSTPTVSTTPAPVTVAPVVEITPVTPTTPAVSAPSTTGLTTTQATAVLSLLSSFGADNATVEIVRRILFGTGTVSMSTVSGSFSRNLELGVTGEDVKVLQTFLNAHGYVIAASGAGSPGNETTRFGALTKAALIKYQEAKGITPAAGYFGPKTRATVGADS